jgi:hypothetical protein
VRVFPHLTQLEYYLPRIFSVPEAGVYHRGKSDMFSSYLGDTYLACILRDTRPRDRKKPRLYGVLFGEVPKAVEGPAAGLNQSHFLPNH